MDEHNTNPTSRPQQPPPYMPDMVPINVLCGQLKPPGARSAKVRGTGQIRFCGSMLHVEVKAKQVGMAALFALIMAMITSYIFTTFFPVPSSPISFLIRILFLSTLNFPVWYPLFHYLMKKRMVLQIDPATHAYYYMQKKQVACLQLPDGRWVAVTARHKRNREELLATLNRIYRGKVTLDSARPDGNYPGSP